MLDSELKAEKVQTAEEKKKADLAIKQELEHLARQADDDSRLRGLMKMMNGRLEDRKEQGDILQLKRPEWMSKPKDDMTDDEKKAVKEFDKNLSVYKEEQEKQRKALETELRKLQASVIQIYDAFDLNLKQLQKEQMLSERNILHLELQIIKMQHASTNSDTFDAAKQNKIDQLIILEKERESFSNDAPDVKKELDRALEDHDSCLQHDKEIERQLKKDFTIPEVPFESLNKLFRKRVYPERISEDHAYNPFVFSTEIKNNEYPLPLEKGDHLEGLNTETWKKFLELRDRKIEAEIEVMHSEHTYREMQEIVQNHTKDLENLHMKIKPLEADLNEFAENKFLANFDVECLFDLKQGQNEITQAPIITDYSDAILINRSVVEKINEEVINLGMKKVEALTEIKDYRKGIHRLEW